MRWRPPARPRRGPAGSRSTCSPRRRTAPSLGVVPCYLKSHSRGEYVFDRGWAEAYERAGGQYYPKLQVSVPFTPATGRRLLVRPGARRRADARRPRRRPDRAVPPPRGLVGPPHLPAARRNASSWPSTASCTAPTSSSTGRTTATRPSTRSSRRCRPASARPSAASGATRWPRHHRALADRQGPDRRGLGRLLRVLHGDRLAQMGPALPDPRSSIR